MEQRAKAAEKDATVSVDPRLEAIIQLLFERCGLSLRVSTRSLKRSCSWGFQVAWEDPIEMEDFPPAA